jgi:hypothetical protein
MINSPENMNDRSLQNENSATDTTQIAGLSKVVEKERPGSTGPQEIVGA